ncbi:MAG: hypothetical protein WD021_04725 [Rhodothermales bacterium]
MEKLHCKACGSYSMVPMDVVVEDDIEGVDLGHDDQDSRFYTCHVCGDNWLSVKETRRGDYKITFVHQMGMSPELKRVAHVDAPVTSHDESVDQWEYYVDDERIGHDAWHEKLVSRRNVLKSICSN